MLLAIFPLQLVILPNEEMPLHIFEPRYKQLIAECRDEGITFGIPAAIENQIAKFGTEVELVKIFKTYDTGEMDIIVRGVRVFRIDNLHDTVPGKLYAGADVTWIEPIDDGDPESAAELNRLFQRLCRLVKQDAPWDTPPQENLSYNVARYVGLDLRRRLEILSITSEARRRAFLIAHIERMIDNIENSVDDKTILGGNGHVRIRESRG